MMYRFIAWAGILLGASALHADELPLPRKVEPALPPVLPLLGEKPPNDGSLDLVQLREEIAKLRAEREALQAAREAPARADDKTDTARTEQINRLRQRLAEVLKQLETPRPQRLVSSPAPPPQPLPAKPTPVPETPGIPAPLPKVPGQQPPIVTAAPVDTLSLAEALFQANDFEGALTAYRLVNPEGLSATDRLTVQYFTAVCLRKLGKTDEASTLFREVGNSRGDQTLVECAQWQLGAIRWKRDLEAQLAEMQQRRKAMEDKP